MTMQVPSGSNWSYPKHEPSYHYASGNFPQTHGEQYGHPTPEPPLHEAQQELVATGDRSAFERALEVVKNVFVIVTCTAILYSLVEVYLFIGRLQEALQQLSDHLTLGG